MEGVVDWVVELGSEVRECGWSDAADVGAERWYVHVGGGWEVLGIAPEPDRDDIAVSHRPGGVGDGVQPGEQSPPRPPRAR
jgi:hypothetical protein